MSMGSLPLVAALTTAGLEAGAAVADYLAGAMDTTGGAIGLAVPLVAGPVLAVTAYRGGIIEDGPDPYQGRYATNALPRGSK